MENLFSTWSGTKKKINSLLPFLYFVPLIAFSTPDVSFDLSRFRLGESAFVEASLYIVGSSLLCREDQDYGIEYSVLIRDKENQIISGNRYRLTSSGCPAKDLIDIKRFTLKPGTYTMEIEVIDIVDTLSNVTIQHELTMDAFDAMHLSDPQLLSTARSDPEGNTVFHKSGVYLEPLPFSLYYPALRQILVYTETYDTDKLEGQPYLQYTISPVDGQIPPPVVSYKKVQKAPVNANVFQLDISHLISGHYDFEVSLYNGNKELIQQHRQGFTRYNPVGDSIFIETGSLNLESSFIMKFPEDSLDYVLRAMAPVVNSVDVDIMNSLLKKGSARAKQFFIHRYFTREAGKYAQVAFESYMKVAHFTDNVFRSGFGYGFETDRGHIFLKYGKPNEIIEVEDEPSAPPYEIWIYNTFPATHQNNVRFLFYNPSLTKNGHKLLHSTAIGEVRNERWEVELYKDATLETPGVNEKVMGDNVQRNARMYFEQY